MKIAFFDTHTFDREIFSEINKKLDFNFEISYFEVRLTPTTMKLAVGHDAICTFVNDAINKEIVEYLKSINIGLIALRSAGFNQVDLQACNEQGIKVVRVPAYSPNAVAEHALCLILALNRKIHRSYNRVRELNFSLDGLVGFDLFGKTVGVVGTGKIGTAFARAMAGLGCKVLAFDNFPNEDLSREGILDYVNFEKLLEVSDIISLHLPLSKSSRHIINEKAISKMKAEVMLINTSRGALIDASALIEGLKAGKISAAGLDVYEGEEGIFFYDLSNQILKDDILARLLTFPNVLITAHQAFLTREALSNIAETTLGNVKEYNSFAIKSKLAEQKLTNEVEL